MYQAEQSNSATAATGETTVPESHSASTLGSAAAAAPTMVTEAESSPKRWGKDPYWGLGFEYDPQWILTPEQLQLQQDLIQICQSTLRPNAVISDQSLIYPRKNFEALAQLNLLGLIVPKHLGGRGENHVCAAMVVETIARYGCPSTAMCYTMHLCATAGLLYRHYQNDTITQLLGRLDSDVLIGTLSYSDPETGSHFWYPLSSKAEFTDRHTVKVNKKASWTTSAGFADWYILQTTSPNFNGDYSNLSCFLFFNDEVKTDPSQWNGLGLRGNQSGTLEVSNVEIPLERIIGPVGDGINSNDEIVDIYFLICSSACWNGISMGLIDIAKNHTTSKKHADVGLRVADYPTIQDYVGEAITDTTAVRLSNFHLAQQLDERTQNSNWDLYLHQPLKRLRSPLMTWLWQLKFSAAKNVNHVSDKMLHACGGTGYKPQLGIERLLRDAKAGWVMGPTNEVLRQFIGKSALLGMESLDYWNQSVNERVLFNEIKKMDPQGKKQLAEKLLSQLH